MSAAYNDPLRMLRCTTATAAAYRSVAREYRYERVTMIRREARRETDDEIRAEVRGIITTVATD